MANPPSGTLTFLFTDIEGSTKLWDAQPEAMRLALADHDAILREAIQAAGGHVIKTTGDGIHAVFAAPLAGVAATLAAQGRLQVPLAGLPIRVRMGLHTGAAELRDGDYYGGVPNRAARLMSIASGGQILLSLSTAELVRDHLPAGAALSDLGEHRLKDLVRPERVFQLNAPALPAGFPALRSLDVLPNNLPVQLTSFVGREHELGEVKRLLAGARLLTLTGSGGTGKTRLSLQAAADGLDAFPHGVWLVELAPLSDPDLVLQAVAATLKVREQPERALIDTLVDHLRAKSLLLILDNCEHVIEACARLAVALLGACPALKILASSREALGVGGETAYRVPSLGLPDPRAATAAGLLACESVRLFIERAQSAQPHFAPTGQNTAALAQICLRLDGIPLAIELAAARVKLFSPEQIAARLDDRFRLLTGGSRTAMPRQQTLRALIDWSYDLLSEAERSALRALSVFAGGWTFEAAEAVCGAGALDVLARLADKSLVVVDDQPGAPRYRLLETIRQYAREKLLDAHEAHGAHQRHLDFHVALAETAAPGLWDRNMIATMERLEVELDNLRAALEWGLEMAPLAALRIAASLWSLFETHVSPTEGLRWVRAAVARTEALPSAEHDRDPGYLAARARALTGESSLAFGIGENGTARAAAEASIALARQIDAPDVLALALGQGSMACGLLGDRATARAWAEEALVIARRDTLWPALSIALGSLVVQALFADEPVPDSLMEENERVARALGNPMALAAAEEMFARLESQRGNPGAANARFEHAARLYGQLQYSLRVHVMRSEQAGLLRRLGRLAEALALYRGTIIGLREAGHQSAVAHELESIAFIAIAAGAAPRAARLLGAAESLRERLAAQMLHQERAEYDENLAALRQRLTPDAHKAAWSDGRALSIDEAIAYAVEPGTGQPA